VDQGGSDGAGRDRLLESYEKLCRGLMRESGEGEKTEGVE
jgi:hypothetical protein